MSDEYFDTELSWNPSKKSRHFHYDIKMMNKKSHKILSVRHSKKGGSSIIKLLDDAFFLLDRGIVYLDMNDIDRIIEIQRKYYENSPTLFGEKLIGWSPETIKRIKEISEREKNHEKKDEEQKNQKSD